MTDNQAGWVVDRDALIDQALSAIKQDYSEECTLSHPTEDYVQNAVMQLVEAGWRPRYEPGDAVEKVCRAYCESKHWDPDEPVTYSGTRKVCKDPDGHIVKQWEMHQEDVRAVITAAFPELLARIEALENEARVERHTAMLYANVNRDLRAEIDRLRKGVL